MGYRQIKPGNHVRPGHAPGSSIAGTTRRHPGWLGQSVTAGLAAVSYTGPVVAELHDEADRRMSVPAIRTAFTD